mmetsp:Transcript_78596/g.163320  ORF Transcript_78596/g.163320 Transcript_78596/m.163320 type:complete len:569 (-) Transcript_78596:405-2111(-)
MGALDMVIATISAVSLPKTVILSNFRLGVLMNLLTIGALIFVIYMIVGTKSYLKIVEVKGYQTQWVSSPPEAYEAGVLADLAKPFCTDPQHYAYKYDDEWLYQDHSCASQFVEERRGYKESADAVYIPTFYQETATQRVAAPTAIGSTIPDCNLLSDNCDAGWKLLEANSMRGALCECAEERNIFMTGVETLKIGLEHYFDVTEAPVGIILADPVSSQASSARCQGSRWSCYQEGNEMMTLVVAENTNKVIHQSLAPSAISISIADILEGAEISLDDNMTDTVENLLLCSTEGADKSNCRTDVEKYPLVRMTGADIMFNIEYVNHYYFPTDYKELDGFSGPLCLIKVLVNKKWVGKPATDCRLPKNSKTFEMDCVQRYQYGIRVGFSVTGIFGVFDLQSLLVTIGAGLVYLMMPVKIVSFIAMHLLGPVSSVYKKASKQRIALDEELADLAVQGITVSQAFKSIVGNESHLTVEALREEMQKVFKHEDLNDDELAHLADVVAALLSKGDEKVGVTLPQIMEALKGPMNIKDAIKLFDKDRSKAIFERIFATKLNVKPASVVPAEELTE